MGKNLLTKTSLGKPPNEMGNCPFGSPLVAPLSFDDVAVDFKIQLSLKDN